MHRKGHFVLKTTWGSEHIKMDDILYLKYEARAIKVYTQKEEFVVNKTLEEAYQELSDQFLYVNRNTIVNRNYIKAVKGFYLYMYHCSEPIEISRRRKKQITNAIFEKLDKI